MKYLQLEKTLRKKVIVGHYEKYLKLKIQNKNIKRRKSTNNRN